MANNRIMLKVKPKVDESKGNYTKHFLKGKTLYSFDGIPGLWNGPNRTQEFDPETFEPLLKNGVKVEHIQPLTLQQQREQQLQGLGLMALRTMIKLPIQELRKTTKGEVIRIILESEGLLSVESVEKVE